MNTLGGPLAWFARRGAKAGKAMKVPTAAARLVFCNGMTRQQRTFTLARLHPESVRIVTERADRRGCPMTCPARGYEDA